MCNNINININDNFICNCGREFKTKKSLNSHARFCDKYVTKVKHESIYKIDSCLYKCECNREFSNYQALNGHFSHCEKHHLAKGTFLKKRKHEILREMSGWSKFSEEDKKDFHLKSSLSYKENIKNNKTSLYWIGKNHKEESKYKIRIGTLNYLKENKNFQGPRYSVKACNYINNLNKQNNWNLQHAKNGGEIEIDGFFVDGYDKNLNIVFEYDESYHYIDTLNNILKNKDINRQEYIINKIKCDFYRYNEKLNLFYKV